jgi:hypothetical protein
MNDTLVYTALVLVLLVPRYSRLLLPLASVTVVFRLNPQSGQTPNAKRTPNLINISFTKVVYFY